MSKSQQEIETEQISWAEFLESTPPNTWRHINDLYLYQWVQMRRGQESSNKFMVSTPELQLYCESETCGGERIFRCDNRELISINYEKPASIFMNYLCGNCNNHVKTFAVVIEPIDLELGELNGAAVKYGELPAFGPTVPARVLRLIQSDRDLFLKGRRAENMGLGIGAFAYYRQVVENQKDRLIGEIVRVSKRVGTDSEVVANLEKALTQYQFSQALDDTKMAFPSILLINGHNPLALLHNALSEGLHAGTDEACLELATDIRLVLTELAERISQVLKDDAELKQAVARLAQRRVKPEASTES